jgi:hypothetical protein
VHLGVHTCTTSFSCLATVTNALVGVACSKRSPQLCSEYELGRLCIVMKKQVEEKEEV